MIKKDRELLILCLRLKTNEVIFHEKRASAYKGKAVEFFVKTLEITIDNYYSL